MAETRYHGKVVGMLKGRVSRTSSGRRFHAGGGATSAKAANGISGARESRLAKDRIQQASMHIPVRCHNGCHGSLAGAGKKNLDIPETVGLPIPLGGVK
jgi:hypothetical protein